MLRSPARSSHRTSTRSPAAPWSPVRPARDVAWSIAPAIAAPPRDLRQNRTGSRAVCAPMSPVSRFRWACFGAFLCDSVDFRAIHGAISARHAGRTRHRLEPDRGRRGSGRQSRDARPPAPGPHHRAGPGGRRGARRGAVPRARRVRHDDPPRPRGPRAIAASSTRSTAARRPSTTARSSSRPSSPSRPASRPRRTPSPRPRPPLVEPGMAIALSAGTTTHALARRLVDTPRITVVTNSIPVSDVLHHGGPAGPDDHPDRWRADALGGARRAVRGRRPAHGPRRPRLHGRARDGPPLRVHLPEPPRGGHRPGAHRGRPAARRRRRPHEVGRHRDQLDGPPGAGRRPHHGPRARPARRGRRSSAPCSSSSSSIRTPPRGSRPMAPDEMAPGGHLPPSAGRRSAPPLQPAPRRVGARLRGARRAALAGRPGAGGRPRSPDVRARLLPLPRATSGPTGSAIPPTRSTFVFVNDYSALRADTSEAVVEQGLLRAEGERGVCRVVCFSPRHDLTLGLMPPAEIARVDRRVGRADDGARRAVPVGPGLREPGRRDGCLQPAPARPDLGRDRPAGRGRAGRAPPRPRTSPRPAGACSLDYAAQESGGPRVVVETAEWLVVVPFWAAWPFETLVVPRRPAARLPDLDATARGGARRGPRRAPRPLRRALPAVVPLLHGLAPGAVRRRRRRPEAGWQVHAHFYPPLLRAGVRKFMVGYELLAETQRDLTPEDAAARLREVAVAAGLAS